MNLSPQTTSPWWKPPARFVYHRLRRVLQWVQGFPGFFTERWRYWKSYWDYSRLPGAERLFLSDAFPCLHEHSSANPFDAAYFYMNVWASRRIIAAGVSEHVDVGSQVVFVGFLASVLKIVFIDIRPLEARLENLRCRTGSILQMPYPDDSVPSLSSLHVLEHIGLGRYGDPLDPLGSRKGAKELARVLAPGGNLFVALPVGQRSCVRFNAHRVHTIQQVKDLFEGLELVELSGINSKGDFLERCAPEQLEVPFTEACGCFWFRKPLPGQAE